MIDVASRVYTSHAAGSIIADWAEVGTSNYLEKCTPNQRGTFGISANEPSVGSSGGYETFPTSDPGIGIQVRYAYPRGRDLTGSARWSDWIGLTETQNRVTVFTHHGVDPFSDYVDVRVQFRFVARTDISGNRTIERGRILHVEDQYWGTTLHQKQYESFTLDAPRAANCWFTSVDDAVTLPLTSTMMLTKEGDVGPSKGFKWSFRCDYGNLGATEAIGIDYTAGTAATDPDNGRMSVTGGAQGVDLQVRRWNGSAMVPVNLGSREWVRRDEVSGTEELDVRYMRNSDPLVPGPANGSLKIYIEPW
ncbi:fimbrial protein [Stenotrophomonas sepilia]|uniref:fimbrial protein n=1 Tax=Stenotrophomonas sepilia TaxID=2860290 RepID=UPI003340298D